MKISGNYKMQIFLCQDGTVFHNFMSDVKAAVWINRHFTLLASVASFGLVL
jgi:hypothetical protein